MRKEYKHLVMFNSIKEAFEYQNEHGGELYINNSKLGTHIDYYNACTIDRVKNRDLCDFPIVVASDYIVAILENK